MEAMSSVYPFVYVCVQQHYSDNCILMIFYIETCIWICINTFYITWSRRTVIYLPFLFSLL